MEMMNNTIVVTNLDNVQKSRMRDWIASEEQSQSKLYAWGTHGDLGTTAAVVILSLEAIKLLAVVLATSSQGHKIRKETETTSNGITKREVIEITIKDAKGVKEIIRAIGEAFKFDISSLLNSWGDKY